jgi:alcohol dehydrogenase
MKAVVLESVGSPLVVKEVPEPTLGTGEVLVDVVASSVLAYAGDVFSGKRKYLFSTPMIPGPSCIGRIHAVGLDATTLAVGDWVFCDPAVRARDGAAAPTMVLQGLTAGDERGMGLLRYVPNGAWAERARFPTENANPIGAIDEDEATTWASLGSYLVPYGGFEAVGLRPGENVVVNGATGSFGSAGVAVALALGAASVVATGRNRRVLDDLVRRFGPRVRPAPMSGDEEVDRKRILETAPGPIDVVLDLLPPVASPAQVRAAVRTVGRCGRVVLMGGVREDVALPYAWLMRDCITVRGQWMYSREAISRVVSLVRAGLLKLDAEITSFSLDQVEDAVVHAAETGGPFKATVLCPSLSRSR